MKTNLRERLTWCQCAIRPKVDFAPEFNFNCRNFVLEWSWMHLHSCMLLCFQFCCEVLGIFPCHAAKVWLLCVEGSN